MDLEAIKNLQKQIDELRESLGVVIPNHIHNGLDSSRIFFSDIVQRKIWVHHTIAGTAAATGTNYGVFFIVPVACSLTKFQEVHQTAGSDAGAVTVTLEKLTGTTAPDSGTEMLASTLSLKATANTVQSGTLAALQTTLQLAAGDRLCLKDSGTLTAVVNVTTLTELQLK